MTLAAPPTSLDLESVSPSLEPGSAEYYGGELSASRYYRMTFFFSEQVTCTSASLRFPDGTYSPCATQISGSSIQVGFSTQIMEAYNEGKLKKGDTAKIRLVGVKCEDFPDIRYGSNGRLEVEFKVADKPIELVEMVNGPTTGMENFLSYYLPDDPMGKITMTFDGDISPAVNQPFAMLTYGNPEDVEHTMYHEYLPVSVDGKTLTIDLTNKLRRPADMIPGLPAESAEKLIGMRIGNIYSADGQMAFTGSMSAYSTFNYGFNIQTVSYTFASDYTPALGTKIRANDPVEIWIMNGKRAYFDGLKLSYTKSGAAAETILSNEDIQVSDDSEDPEAVLINFNMPDLGADEGSKITLLPVNLFFADGMDHSADIIGEYEWTDEAGVDSAETADKISGDIYNATGILILRNATRADLRKLPSGLYIFGNKKVVVR